jgi:4-amino-4-deoxy-L-arabinose transferase-like glycosyltransferase
VKYENAMIALYSIVDAVAIVILGYLYMPSSIKYAWVYFLLSAIFFYWSVTKNDYLKEKLKAAKDGTVGTVVLLIYSFIIFYISPDAFRKYFLLYEIPFVIAVIAIFYYINYYRRKMLNP